MPHVMCTTPLPAKSIIPEPSSGLTVPTPLPSLFVALSTFPLGPHCFLSSWLPSVPQYIPPGPTPFPSLIVGLSAIPLGPLLFPLLLVALSTTVHSPWTHVFSFPLCRPQHIPLGPTPFPSLFVALSTFPLGQRYFLGGLSAGFTVLTTSTSAAGAVGVVAAGTSPLMQHAPWPLLQQLQLTFGYGGGGCSAGSIERTADANTAGAIATAAAAAACLWLQWGSWGRVSTGFTVCTAGQVQQAPSLVSFLLYKRYVRSGVLMIFA